MKFTATTREAAAALRLSETTLRRLRREGVLRPGTHYIALGAGTVAPSLLWNPSECQEALAKRSRRICAA